MFVSFMHVCESFCRNGIIGSSARATLRYYQIVLQTGWIHLDSHHYYVPKFLILANLTLKKVWKKEPFKAFLKNTQCYNPNTSLIILYSLLVLFHFLYFSEVLTTCCLRGQDKSQLLSPCYPFSSALKEVWSDNVGQRRYRGGTVCTSGRTEIEG